ncbi:MAG: cohesin domain-containing protein [Candidatus Bathyarchaeota archaeon]
MAVIVVIALSLVGQVLARFLLPIAEEEGPVILGTFSVTLEVGNVGDLYTWQVAVSFNPSELEIMDTAPGDFVGEEFPLFVTSEDSAEDMFLLGGTLKGETSGKDGSGILATITFGYLTEEYSEPAIVTEEEFTFLLDSTGQSIPDDEYTLSLTSS